MAKSRSASSDRWARSCGSVLRRSLSPFLSWALLRLTARPALRYVLLSRLPRACLKTHSARRSPNIALRLPWERGRLLSGAPRRLGQQI